MVTKTAYSPSPIVLRNGFPICPRCGGQVLAQDDVNRAGRFTTCPQCLQCSCQYQWDRNRLMPMARPAPSDINLLKVPRGKDIKEMTGKKANKHSLKIFAGT